MKIESKQKNPLIRVAVIEVIVQNWKFFLSHIN